MNYQVLARKWRPQVFEDVVGQGHITKTLQNAITANRLAHAFLFSGPRGVGKTTTARILAKALNCVQGPTPNPCGACDSCIETTAGTSVDVIEIDGASNRGIEHIRELREAVKYSPSRGKSKVYVIDEVHMLTNEAFNALLKTLEEPPPRVVFIFATTEPQKIPATIHSRCQRYGFKRVALQEIIARLRTIAASEGIHITDQGLAMIARAAEGSMRDSLSLLDQSISYSGTEIKDEDLQISLGAVAQEALRQFTASLLSKNGSALLAFVDALLEQGQDLRQFLSGAVEHLRNLLVVKITGDPGKVMELPAADIDAIRQQASSVETEHLLMLFDSLSTTLDDMRWSPHQRFTLEIGLIKACSMTPLKPLGEVLTKMKELEVLLASGNKPSSPGVKPATRVSERPSAYVPAAPRAGSSSRDDVWGSIIAAMKIKKPSLVPILEQSRLLDLSETDLLVGVGGNRFQAGQMEKAENCKLIEHVAGDILKRTIVVKLQSLVEHGTQAKIPSKTAAAEENPMIKDVLSVFPQGEVIEQSPPGE